VYDGWNLIAILDSNSSLLASFQRGIDASGTIQGAGGVEGLISMTVHQGANAGTYFYCYDGNHNVATLVNATNGAVAAQYEYDAFLGILRATGPLAFVNPFVGSTKFCDWETGFLYYGYRYYDPDTGRWPNRDPVDELGHRVLLNEEKLKKVRPDRGNLYGFVRNNPANRIDADGRYDFLSSIELCNRQVENPSNDFILGCCNIRGHDFYRWPDGNGGFGSVGYQNPIGKNGDKPTPDHPEKARLCSRCYRSSGILKYGSNGSSGKGKSGYSASDAEIIDCLKNRPIKGDYRGLRNNCNDWARGAAKDCGLWCSGNSDLVK
jgi:RHS repeat-associated protein